MRVKLILLVICVCMVEGCKSPALPVREASLPAPAEIGSNRYVIYALDASCKISIDTSKATNLADWAEHRLAPVLADWYPIMSATLPTPGFTPPTNWTVILAPGDGVASTSGTRVTANSTWLKGQMDKAGLFSSNEIKDLFGVVERWRKQSGPISTFLWKGLSKEDRSVLKNYDPVAENTNEVGAVVLQNFNKMLEGPSIYTPARFKGISLSCETMALLHQNAKDIELSQVNRLLLQDAYVNELSRTHKEGIGALVHEEVHVVQQYGSARRLNPPGNFGVNDITNLVSLAKKLKEHAEPVSALLWRHLGSTERNAIANYRGPGPADYYTRTNLVVALNRIIRGPALYDKPVFKGVTLRDSTISLREEKPEGANLARLNRVLLEDAYPGEMSHDANAGSGGRRGGGGAPGWLTEGIADYIRWFEFQPEAHGADFIYFKRRADPRYDGQYRPTAYFLDFVTRQYDAHIVAKLNDVCRQGKYYEAIWFDNTGKSLLELNAEWLDLIKKKKQEASIGTRTDQK